MPINDRDDAAKFAFPEIVLGTLMGQGGFSNVYEVADLELNEIYETSQKQTVLRKVLVDKLTQHECRLVVKLLRDDLPEDEHTKGVLDLAVEARFLKRLSHENIVTMKAMANSDPLESRFFVILEMLPRTLEHKLDDWREEINKSNSIWCGPMGYCCANKMMLQQLWIERFIVAKSIASAIKYLHEEEILYRDLKPENIGVDHDGIIKLFDFGLAKRLHPDDKDSATGLYKLTGNTGSLRYMAPEIALNQSYDERADAYSFGIVFWQICSLTLPYAGFNCKMHADLVVDRGSRPKIEMTWPATWIYLMKKCWDSAIYERPHFDFIMDTVSAELDGLLAQSGDSEIKAIKSKKKLKENEAPVLDVDTRISKAEVDPAQLTNGQMEDVEIV